VPSEAAPDLVAALHVAGFAQAAVIGVLRDGAPGITVTNGDGPGSA